jgi:stage III sporulation protein AG
MSKVTQFWQEIKKNLALNKIWLWGLGLLGAVLLIWPVNCQGGKEQPLAPLPVETDYQFQLQRELENILARIEGAGRVTVFLTLEDEAEVIYARNEEVSRRTTNEEDSQGGVRQQLEYDSRGQLVFVQTGGQEEPVVVKVIKPRVRGVLVVAEGAGNSLVRERLTHAVQGALDLPAYKITVQKGH